MADGDRAQEEAGFPAADDAQAAVDDTAARLGGRSRSERLANLRHELRTPLNAIIGFSELLADGSAGALNPRQSEYLDYVLTAGRHLLDVSNDLLDLAKIEAGRTELEPSKLDPAAHSRAAGRRREAAPDAAKRILVVDDVEQNLFLLRGMVESLGFAVETARDGSEALAKLLLDVDLILLDVMMPGLDGFEVARRMRADANRRDVPIIMVTALDNREDRLRAVEAGANDFIAKPVDKTELAVRLVSQLKLKEAQDALKRSQAELEQQVLQRTEALRRALQATREAQRRTYAAQLDTIRRLVLAAQYKDLETAEHIQRLSRYAVVLAEALRLPPGEVEVLCHAIPMHDVGKIGIPDSVLLKPGPLTPDERQVMSSHAVIGAHILTGSSSELLQAGEIIALSHHEWWDGSGYPRGLRGEEIPRWGRLCAIIDVFDALLSNRPYRPALSVDQALELMRQGRGRQFEPGLFDLFLAHLGRMLEIHAGAAAANLDG